MSMVAVVPSSGMSMADFVGPTASAASWLIFKVPVGTPGLLKNTLALRAVVTLLGWTVTFKTDSSPEVDTTSTASHSSSKLTE